MYLDDWDLGSGFGEETFPSFFTGSDALDAPILEDLVPRPLRVRTDSTVTTLRPLSPAPTVFVALHIVPPTKEASGSVSLHRYRKSLSESRPDISTPAPSRSLKRKPKAINLNKCCTHRTPPSPPPSPPLSPPLSPLLKRFPSTSSRYSDHPVAVGSDPSPYSRPGALGTPGSQIDESESVYLTKSVSTRQNQGAGLRTLAANSSDSHLCRLVSE